MKERIVTKNFVFTFTALLSLSLVMYTLMSTITEYASDLGVSTTVAGFVSGIYVVGGLFSRMYSGGAMEKYGWKRICLIFGVLHLGASCLYSLADSVALLLVIRFIHGVGFGATINSVMLIGMAGLPKSRYGEAGGYFMMASSLGVAIGPYIGGVIYDSFGGSGCFAAAAVFSLIIVLSMAMVDTRELDPRYKRDKAAPETAKGKSTGIARFLEVKVIPIAMSLFCLCFGYAALMSFYRLFAQYVDMTDEFRYFFLIYAAMLVVARPAAGKIQDRFGDDVVCYPCVILQVLGIVLVAWKPCVFTMVLCALFGALGYGTLNSTMNVIVNRQVADERRPYATATYWAFSDLGIGVAPAILGAIETVSNYAVMYYAAAAISLLALPVYYLAVGRKKR